MHAEDGDSLRAEIIYSVKQVKTIVINTFIEYLLSKTGKTIFMKTFIEYSLSKVKVLQTFLNIV